MDIMRKLTDQSHSGSSIAQRALLMAGVVAALIGGSSQTRKLPPGQRLTIWINVMFFVALGAADEWLLAPVLNERPLLRAEGLVSETLVLGWFFSPGRDKPASKTLFYVHIAPFFVAVFGGVSAVTLVRRLRGLDA